MKKKIAVISDTHGTLREELLERIGEADAVLHCGDIASQKALDKLSETAEIIPVRGNCDGPWAEDIPEERLLDLYGKKIYMVHDRKNISSLADEADIVLFGHSHKYEETYKDGKLYLNPGSGGPRRFGRPISMAILEIDPQSGEVDVEKIDL